MHICGIHSYILNARNIFKDIGKYIFDHTEPKGNCLIPLGLLKNFDWNFEIPDNLVEPYLNHLKTENYGLFFTMRSNDSSAIKIRLKGLVIKEINVKIRKQFAQFKYQYNKQRNQHVGAIEAEQPNDIANTDFGFDIYKSIDFLSPVIITDSTVLVPQSTEQCNGTSDNAETSSKQDNINSNNKSSGTCNAGKSIEQDLDSNDVNDDHISTSKLKRISSRRLFRSFLRKTQLAQSIVDLSPMEELEVDKQVDAIVVTPEDNSTNEDSNGDDSNGDDCNKGKVAKKRKLQSLTNSNNNNFRNHSHPCEHEQNKRPQQSSSNTGPSYTKNNIDDYKEDETDYYHLEKLGYNVIDYGQLKAFQIQKETYPIMIENNSSFLRHKCIFGKAYSNILVPVHIVYKFQNNITVKICECSHLLDRTDDGLVTLPKNSKLSSFVVEMNQYLILHSKTMFRFDNVETIKADYQIMSCMQIGGNQLKLIRDTELCNQEIFKTAYKVI